MSVGALQPVYKLYVRRLWKTLQMVLQIWSDAVAYEGLSTPVIRRHGNKIGSG